MTKQEQAQLKRISSSLEVVSAMLLLSRDAMPHEQVVLVRQARWELERQILKMRDVVRQCDKAGRG